MKDRPILFTGPMVRAILDGRKTRTRRPVKNQKHPHGTWATPEEVAAEFIGGTCAFSPPLGTIGDRLWVREAFEICRETCSYECEEYDLFPWDSDIYGDPKDSLKPKCPRGGYRSLVLHRADEEEAVERWTPSIHMPRWASRIDLEITRVWVERVQDITEEDALKEGCEDSFEHSEDCDNENCTLSGCPDECVGFAVTAKTQFRDLWQSIYANWDANPWVWVYEFRRIKP